MRTKQDNDDSGDFSGQDSFLDIVANIVGILILLVVVVGVRASQDAVAAAQVERKPLPTAKAAVDPDQLRKAERLAIDAHKDVETVIKQVVNVNQAAALRDEERIVLNTMVTSAEREIAEYRAKLSEQEQLDFDVRRQLSEAKNTLDNLTREQVSMLTQAPKVEELENLPTPLARTVSGDEVHLRLDKGRVAFIPVDELIAQLQEDAEDNRWRLKDRDVVDSVVGPLNGFRLRYRLRKRQLVLRDPSGAVQRATVTNYTGWQLLPTKQELGEPVDQAVLPNSDLMHFLKPYRPESTTVTVWTYPGSFNEFRQLKQTLFEMGFGTAARPMPEGKLIGGSPQGSKSSAQ
jgi:hypothetical protein